MRDADETMDVAPDPRIGPRLSERSCSRGELFGEWGRGLRQLAGEALELAGLDHEANLQRLEARLPGLSDEELYGLINGERALSPWHHLTAMKEAVARLEREGERRVQLWASVRELLGPRFPLRCPRCERPWAEHPLTDFEVCVERIRIADKASGRGQDPADEKAVAE